MNRLPLGKSVRYPKTYNPGLLYPIKRARGRESIFKNTEISFHGMDIWNLYEVSWLRAMADGSIKPEADVIRLLIDSKSPSIPESKSLKLYLTGLNNTLFSNRLHLLQTIKKDLQKVCGIEAGNKEFLHLIRIDQRQYQSRIKSLKAKSLDSLKSALTLKQLKSDMIQECKITTNTNKVSQEKLYTNLFRSLCPVTGQPDLATIVIEYSGNRIIKKTLLDYLLTFRNHKGFHEQCCERILHDIAIQANPEELLVSCHFTRRGGIDINPIRFYPAYPGTFDLKEFPGYFRQ